MTEIVADKTVEVVKNAIETADGALDLYNKYLDQVIPWQTFDETIKELSRFKQEYSQGCKFCRRFQAAKSITKRELSKNAHRK